MVDLFATIYTWKRLIWICAARVAIVTFFIEVIGISTGFPFGEYHYTATLGPLLLGVPFTIALAWVGIIANSILLSTQSNKWLRALDTGLWVVVLDLILDPVAEQMNFWHWQHPGAYFQIPTTNFISWYVIGALLSFVFPLVERSQQTHRIATRLFQLMLFMFGSLGWKHGFPSLFPLAIGFIFVSEGRYRYAYRTKKQTV